MSKWIDEQEMDHMAASYLAEEVEKAVKNGQKICVATTDGEFNFWHSSHSPEVCISTSDCGIAFMCGPISEVWFRATGAYMEVTWPGKWFVNIKADKVKEVYTY